MTNLKYSFFFIWSIAFLLIAFIGFTPSFILRPWFRETSIPLYLTVHGILLLMWFAGYFYQSLLVAQRKIIDHRKFGYYWFVLAAAVTIANLNVMVSISEEVLSGHITYYNEQRTMENTGPLLVGNLYLTFTTAALFLVAYLKRSSPKVHSRALFGACYFLLSPAFDRFIRPLGLMEINMFLHFSMSFIIPFSLLGYDIWRYRRPPWITIIFVLLTILIIPVVLSLVNFGFHEAIINFLG